MSQTKISRLTGPQIARMPEWVDRWLAIGLCIAPADWESAERGARGCYTAAGLPPPAVILRMGSPWAAVVGGVFAARLVRSQVDSQVGSQVYSQVGSQVYSQLGSQVRSQVGSQVGSQVYSQVGSQVYSQVGSQVRSQVGSQVGSQVYSQVDSQVGSQVGSQVDSQVYSQWLLQYRGAQLWAAWYAYITFFRDVCDWVNPALAAFAHDEQLALSCGWTWWSDKVCAISDRPRVLRRDDQHRLHCETGPALAYPDGWSIYAWHGVRVPADVIETPPAKISLDRVLAERNTEVARVLIRRAPATLWEDPRVIVADHDVDGAGQPRQLLRVRIPQAEPVTIVRVKCPSTGGEYRLRVPPDVQTCSEAVAWTFRKAPAEYAPQVEA